MNAIPLVSGPGSASWLPEWPYLIEKNGRQMEVFDRPFVRALLQSDEPPDGVFLNYRRKPFEGCAKLEYDRERPSIMGDEEEINYIATLPSGDVRRFALPEAAQSIVGRRRPLYISLTPGATAEDVEKWKDFRLERQRRRDLIALCVVVAGIFTMVIWTCVLHARIDYVK